MKKVNYFLLLFFILQHNAFAVIPDDPCSAFPLTAGTTCSPTLESNSGATNSSITDATCDGGNSNGDVWYTALIGANGTLIIQTQPGTLADMGMAIYTGSNCSTLTFHSCVAGGSPGASAMPYTSLSGMTPGSEIWIRLWDVGNDETGTFNICAFVNCSASVTITGSTTGCTAVPEQLCATPGFSTYSWNGGSMSSCINVNSTATYTVTVTDADGCTATDSHSFTVNSSPSVTITGPSTGCTGNNPQLCVPNGFTTYSWSNGSTTRCTNPAITGTYTVTVSSSNGCTASDSYAITIFASPSITVTGPPSKCSGGSEQLCVASGYSSYSWSTGGTTNCITPASTSTYFVTVTDANGCAASANRGITVNSSPIISVSGPSSACPGTNPQLCVSGGFNQYSWTTGDTVNCISPNSTGTYTATVTDAFGCTGSASKTITIFSPASVVISGPSSKCAGTSAQLCTPTGFSNYNWSSGGTTNCISPASTGNYAVIVTDGNGCTASDNVNFTINPIPSSTITGPASSCNSTPAQLCSTAGSAFYLWSNGATNSCISTSASGNYSVTVTSSAGCTSSSSHALTVYPPFAMNITGPSTACSGSNTQLCASNGNYTYQWLNGATTACISPTVSGTYTVIATNISTGCTRSASKGLTIYTPLNASISGPSSACTGTVVPLCATQGANSYFWSNGQTSECININSNGVFTVTVSDIHGCTASASQAVVFSSSFNVDITGPASGCTGTAAELCVPSGYESYTWSTGDTTPCVSVNNAGNYSVTVHDQVGCVANSFYNLTFNAPPVVSISGQTTICSGSLSNWCATPGFASYLWSNGGVVECINVNTANIYSVQITDTNGCMANDSLTLSAISIQPQIIEDNGLLICDTFNNAFSYSWLINGSPTNCTGDTCSPTFNAIYSVIVTDTTTGCSEIATFNYIHTGNPVLHKDFNVSIFPNPFYDHEFNIGFLNMIAEETEVIVFDATGRIVFNQSITIPEREHIHTFSIPGTGSGIYFVHVKSKTGNIIKKIIGY